MFDKVKDAVKEFSDEVKEKVAKKEVTESEISEQLERLRLKLLKQNVSPQTVDRIENSIRQELIGQKVQRGSLSEKVEGSVKSALEESVSDNFDLEQQLGEQPNSISVMGFNGSGKTTTAAKLAKLLSSRDMDPVLGAADTFRAASIEQLEEHGEKLDCKVIKHEYESDPAAVGYDTVEYAEKNDKTAIIDTAGRSHGDKNLMDELEKTISVTDPDLSFLVIDALSGNDVEEQLEAYKGMFDAIIITKMDVGDGGGVLVTASEKSGKPIAFTCDGQDYSDIEKFEKKKFFDDAFL